MLLPELAGAAAAGLASGAHCLGMCGPAVALAARAGGARRGTAAFLLGKSASYLLLGTVLGTGGALLRQVSPYAPVVVRGGAGLAFACIGAELLWPGRYPKVGLPSLGSWGRRLGSFTQVGGAAAGLALGMLAGLAPCGLSWGMAAWAAGTGSALHGAALMLAFGLGTAPALGFAAYLAQHHGLTGPKFRVLAGLVWLLLGGGLLLQVGRGLGHPAAAACCHEVPPSPAGEGAAVDAAVGVPSPP